MSEQIGIAVDLGGAFGCDPKVFTYSQPVRVPGRGGMGKLQRLVWLRDETRIARIGTKKH